MIKKISSLLLTLLLTITFSMAVSAKTVTTDVFDRAELFIENESIQAQVDNLKELTGWNVAVVTTDDADGKSSMAYADDFYDELFGINTDGILYLIDMDNRVNWISTSGEAILYIDDYRIERILDETTPYLSNGNFDGAALAFLETTSDYYSDGIPSSNKDYTINADGEYVRKDGEFPIGIAALVGVIAAVIAVAIVLVRYKTHSTPDARQYMDGRETAFRDRRDVYIRECTNSTHIGSSSGGGGGGSSTHHSSGGGCHGGGGRGF